MERDWAAIGLAAAALAFAACSGGDETPAATATATTEQSAEVAEGGPPDFAEVDIDDLVACVGEAGFDVDEGPDTLPELLQSTQDDAFREAVTDCAAAQGIELGGDGVFGGGPGGPGFDPEALVECLNEAGIEVELPAATGDDPRGGGLLDSLDRQDPEVRAALEACAPGLSIATDGASSE
jgi:hypothetical protein